MHLPSLYEDRATGWALAGAMDEDDSLSLIQYSETSTFTEPFPIPPMPCSGFIKG
jgi:hypothetical protein